MQRRSRAANWEHLQQLETWFRIPDAPTADRLAWIRRTLSAAAGTWRAWWPFWRGCPGASRGEGISSIQTSSKKIWSM